MSFFKFFGQAFQQNQGKDDSSTISESERRRRRKKNLIEEMQQVNNEEGVTKLDPEIISSPGKTSIEVSTLKVQRKIEENDSTSSSHLTEIEINSKFESKDKSISALRINTKKNEESNEGVDKTFQGLNSPNPVLSGQKKKSSIKIYKGAAFQIPTFDQLDELSDQRILSSSPIGLGSQVFNDIHSSTSLEFSKKNNKNNSLKDSQKTINGNNTKNICEPKTPLSSKSSNSNTNFTKLNSGNLSEIMKPIFQKIGSSEETNIDEETGRPIRHRNQANLELGDDDQEGSLRHEKVYQILSSQNSNIAELRKLAWNGLPCKYRSEAWKLIIGYLPSSKNRREEFLSLKRKEYQEMIDRYYYEKTMKKTEEEINILHQIHIDVPRTNPEVPLFQTQIIQDALERILYIWSIRHASGYVQGLNDIVTPFLVAYLYDILQIPNLLESDLSLLISEEDFRGVEADTFFSFSLFLDMIQDHYSFGQPGIQRMIKKLEDIIEKIDKPLFLHFKSLNLYFLQFAFRWMNCVLMRELSLKQVLRLFDTFLSEASSESSFEKIHVYVCAAFLKNWSEELQNLDFTELVIFLQHLPTQSWTDDDIGRLLSQAYMLMTWFETT